MKTYKFIILLIIAAALVFAVIWAVNEWVSNKSLASVEQSSEYHSTTTTSVATGRDYFVLKQGEGALGSVIITSIASGHFYLYDASTTQSSRRTKTATSSLNLLGYFGPYASSTTYTFDTIFHDGLLVDFTGVMGTTTITWR